MRQSRNPISGCGTKGLERKRCHQKDECSSHDFFVRVDGPTGCSLADETFPNLSTRAGTWALRVQFSKTSHYGDMDCAKLFH